MKKILIFNDFVSFGRVAGGQVDTILTYKGLDVFFIPTALISNIFSMGKFANFDTSSYIEETLKTWKDLDFKFDAIFIGFIKNAKQKDIILNYINSLEEKPLVILDPIMGDSLSLYKGIDKDIVNIYKEIMGFCQIIIPNYTEALILSDRLEKDTEKILKILSKNNKSVIITSVREGDCHFIMSINKGEIKKYPYKHLDKKFAGTGDIFDGIFLSNYLNGLDFDLSIKKTKESMSNILEKNLLEKKDSFDINIERYLDLI